jgi:hypothetical protein
MADIDPSAIAKAREAGYSDHEIAGFLSEKHPEQFKQASDAGYTPKEILDHLSGSSATPSGVVAGLKQGLSTAISGPNETAKVFAGASSDNLDKAAKTIAPENYHPVTGDTFFGPGGVLQNPKNYKWSQLPQAVAEAAPGLGVDIAAARLGARIHPYAGLAAGLGSFALRKLGLTAEQAAETRTGQAGAEPSTEDKLRAAGTTALEAAPQALGVGRFIPGLGVSAAPAKSIAGAAATLAKTAGAEAAAAGGSNVAGQVGMSVGTDKGLSVDPKEAALSAVTGGATGGLFGSSRLVRDVSDAKTYGKTINTPELENAARDFANRVQSTTGGADLEGNMFNRGSAQRAGLEGLNKAHDAVKNELDQAVGRVSTPLSTDAMNTLQAIKKGNNPTAAEWQHLETSLGQDPMAPAVMNLARQSHVATMVRDSGSVKDGKLVGGIATKVGEYLTPHAAGKAALASLAAEHAGAHLIAYSPEILATLAGAYGAGRVLDSATGRASPAGRFVSRFADNSGSIRTNPPPAPPPQPQGNPGQPAGPTGPRMPMNPGVTGALLAKALGQGPWQPQAAPGPGVGAINPLAKSITAGLNQATPAPSRAEDLQAAITAGLKEVPRPVAPAAPPAPMNALALPRDVTGPAKNIMAGATLAQKLKQEAAGRAQAQAEAASSPFLDQTVGGPQDVTNPVATKEMGRLVSAAKALATLRADPEAAAQAKEQAKAEKQAANDQARADKEASKEQARADKQAARDKAQADKQAARAAAQADKEAAKNERAAPLPTTKGLAGKARTIEGVLSLASAPEAPESRQGLPASIRAAAKFLAERKGARDRAAAPAAAAAAPASALVSAASGIQQGPPPVVPPPPVTKVTKSNGQVKEHSMPNGVPPPVLEQLLAARARAAAAPKTEMPDIPEILRRTNPAKVAETVDKAQNGGNFIPLTKEDMPYHGMRHTEAADAKVAEKYASETPDRQKIIRQGIIAGRMRDENRLAAILKQTAAPADRVAIRDLIEEMHHTSSPSRAKQARDYYAARMSPETATQVKAAVSDDFIVNVSKRHRPGA